MLAPILPSPIIPICIKSPVLKIASLAGFRCAAVDASATFHDGNAGLFTLQIYRYHEYFRNLCCKPAPALLAILDGGTQELNRLPRFVAN